MIGQRYITAIAVLGFTGIMLFAGCSRGHKVKIAVMTRLQSGSTVGSSEINASKLFLEERGVHNIEIVPFNDDWEPARAIEAYAEMRSQGIRILITSHVSTCALALRDSINRDRVLTMVTGSATDQLSGSDDFIFRNIQDVSIEQKSIAEYVNRMPGGSLLIIRDTDNHSYTTPALKYFREILRKPSVRVIDVSVSALDMAALESAIRRNHFDTVYVLVGGYKVVAGTIAQMAKKASPGARIVFTPWMKSPALLQTLGGAVKDAVMPSHYPPRSESRAVDEYVSGFKKRFGYAPTFISLNVYAALEILSAAIAAGNTTPDEIKSYILKTGRFETRFGAVEFDAYGDVTKPLYFITGLEREF
ncbi:MAG: amino acid ABC transporter substrate-binding protein [Spirochaetales bacterium]|nr:MAG: amino acid ABC transporter substrate-binding protein [Spirochaetales bacterium]